MKTPMQELIEQLKELKAYTAVTHGLERSLPYQTAIDYAETMLEQEKEAIKDAYDAGLFDGSMEDVDNRLYKDYYNKTFSTSVEMNKQEILNQLHQHIKACSEASLSDAVMAFHEAIKLVEQLDEKQGPEVRWKPQQETLNTEEEMKQSSIEWIYNNLKSHFEHDGDLLEAVKMSFEQAKAMHKEEIENAVTQGWDYNEEGLVQWMGEKYYNETFNTKEK